MAASHRLATPDRCILLLVAEHTRSENPYRLARDIPDLYLIDFGLPPVSVLEERARSVAAAADDVDRLCDV